MSYQDPYDHNYEWNNNHRDPGWHNDSAGKNQGGYERDGISQNLWQSRDWPQQDYEDEWTPYDDPGQKSRSNSYSQKTMDSKYGYSDYQYPPFHPARRTTQKSTSALSKKGLPPVEVMDIPPIEVPRDAGVHKSGFDKGEFTPKRRTPSAYREYRYVNQGNLWTKRGPLRSAGRFCLCTVLTTLFLVVSIALSLVLWMRPPDIQIGPVQSGGGLQKTAGGFQVDLSTVITVNNFNYFDVDMRKIQVEVFYPINNTPIGGGTANDVFFKSGTQTNFTFPFSLTYDTSSDSSGQVFADIATKCGVGGQRSNINVNYKLTLGIQVLLFTLSPVISNTFTFACPIKASDISKVFSGSSG